MEKNGVIKEGLTPPEDDSTSKLASAEEREAALEDHPTRRLSDAAENELRK